MIYVTQASTTLKLTLGSTKIISIVSTCNKILFLKIDDFHFYLHMDLNGFKSEIRLIAATVNLGLVETIFFLWRENMSKTVFKLGLYIYIEHTKETYN